jgi:hypothetical protein
MIIVLILILILILLIILLIERKKEHLNNKIIICCPGGGICDMLNIMNNCFVYAINNNRSLFIDINKLDWFKDDIYKYITFTHPSILKEFSYNNINSIYPPELKNDIVNKLNNTKYDNADSKYRTTDGITLSIDLSKTYLEDIIVYVSCGGGIPEELLKYMYFNPIILDVYYKRLKQLPNNYISLHIRNTDYKSNIEEFISLHDNKLKNTKFFLATDDANTIYKYKLLYGNNVIQFSNIPKTTNNANIHYNHDNLDHTEFIIDSFVDLLLLASANEYYYSSEQSGYSRFANYLFTNKNILNNIVKTNLI